MPAIKVPADDLDAGVPTTPQSAHVLVIGAPATVADGLYQKAIKDLEQKYTDLEKQMADRILERATTLQNSFYQHVSLILPEELLTESLFNFLEPALSPGGTLELHGTPAKDEKIASALTIAGLGGKLIDDVYISIKPKTSSAPLSFSLKRRASKLSEQSPETTTTDAIALKLAPRTSRAAKASLWALTSATPATIDESTLLTEEDLARPTLVQRADCNVKKTRKACKNCSCGLRELELDRSEQDDLVAAGFAPVNGTTNGSSGGLEKQKIRAQPITSSCGSCFLGDAFRCSGCPYLGMPAFEPGQAIKIGASMDDI